MRRLLLLLLHCLFVVGWGAAVGAQGAATASVSSSDDFAAALVDTRITHIVLQGDVAFDPDAWRAFYSRKSPFVLTHNLTITSEPPWSKLDFAWTGDQRVRLAPGVMLNMSRVVLQRSRYGAGVAIDFLAYSPGAFLLLWDTIMVKVVCLSTNSEPDNIAVQPRLPGFPGTQSARYVSPYCLRGTCYTNVLQYVSYTRLTSQNTEDTAAGGYAMIMSNFTKVCLNFVSSSSCSYADSVDHCLQDSLDTFSTGPPYTPRQLEEAAAAAVAARQAAGTRLTAGLIGGLVGGGLLLLAALLLVLRHRRRRGRGFAAGKGGKQPQGGSVLPGVASPGGLPGPDPLLLVAGGQKSDPDAFVFAKAAATGGDIASASTPTSHSSWELAACKTSDRFMPASQHPGSLLQQQPNHLRRYSSGELLQHGVAVTQTPAGLTASLASPSSHQDLSGASAISNPDKISLGVLLGAGSFGRVFKARWRNMDVAVKVLQHSQEAAAGVANEVNLMMQLQHPNIVAAHHFVTWRKRHIKLRPSDAAADVADGTWRQSAADTHFSNPDDQSLSPTGEFHEDTQTWIVQEYCDAGNLGDYVLSQRRQKHPGCLPEGHTMLRLLFRLREVAEGLAYLHERSIVHGDLKAGNVLLSVSLVLPYGRVAKLADFGLSRALGRNETHRSTHTLGTVSHMAPELLRYGKLSTAVDVFSFGVLMWEVLTGSVPWQGLHYGSIIERVALGGERLPVPPGTPDDFELLMCSCWSSDPSQRPEFAQVIKCLDIMIASRQHELAEQQYASSTHDSLQAAAASASAGTAGAAGFAFSKPHSSSPGVQDLDLGPGAMAASIASRSGGVLSSHPSSSSRSHIVSVAAGPAVSGHRLLQPAAAGSSDTWMSGPHGPQDL